MPVYSSGRFGSAPNRLNWGALSSNSAQDHWAFFILFRLRQPKQQKNDLLYFIVKLKGQFTQSYKIIIIIIVSLTCRQWWKKLFDLYNGKSINITMYILYITSPAWQLPVNGVEHLNFTVQNDPCAEFDTWGLFFTFIAQNEISLRKYHFLNVVITVCPAKNTHYRFFSRESQWSRRIKYHIMEIPQCSTSSSHFI